MILRHTKIESRERSTIQKFMFFSIGLEFQFPAFTIHRHIVPSHLFPSVAMKANIDHDHHHGILPMLETKDTGMTLVNYRPGHNILPHIKYKDNSFITAHCDVMVEIHWTPFIFKSCSFFFSGCRQSVRLPLVTHPHRSLHQPLGAK